MLKRILFVLTFFLSAVSFACSSTETTNVNLGNGSAANKVDSANIPPEFSTNSVPLSANSAPGIDPANANKVPTGNIPGIPDTTKTGKTPQPKKTPPIPGIPDEKTIKEQMNKPIKDMNVVNNPSKSQSDVNNRPAEKPRGNRQP
ncbi:MAG: hypothetical protein M3367_00405 [Acidobacteriota bacterium]|nr:hypothetical protein [Acidobacteriota bacterium]